VLLIATNEPSSALSIFLQGSAVIAPTAFGDGLRCVGGSVRRLFVKSAILGNVRAPDVGDPSITQRSAALGDLLTSGTVRSYQVYYRDPAAGFCPPPLGNTWNVSNALTITW
jgi:hypothetical protein